MKFHEWITHYETTKKQVNIPNLTIDEYWKAYLKHGKPILTNSEDGKVMETSLFLSETYWLRQGKPYYNIHSSILEPLERMRLNSVTVGMLGIPKDFTVINIRFPTEIDYPVKTMLVGHGLDNIFICATFGNINDSICFFTHKLYHELTLEEFINNRVEVDLQDRSEGAIAAAKCGLKSLALVKFLTDCPNDELMEYDVLSKMKSEYFWAKPERRQEIEVISRKQRKLGWNIGVSERIVFNAPRLTDVDDDEIEKIRRHELTHAHVRTGHLHAVRFGKGKAHVKVMFYRPTVVGKGKPFK